MRRTLVLLCVAALLVPGCGQRPATGRVKLGYVVNYMSHEWYQNICNAARQRAAELGVDLIIADANLDMAAQISRAENLITQGVSVLILTPVDAKALGPLVRQAKAAGVRVVTESNPVEGSDTYVGIDNEAAGRKAGRWYGEYAAARGIEPRILIIGLPNFEDCRLRAAGFRAGLEESGTPFRVVQEVDGQGLKERSFKVAQDALTAHPEVNAIFGINDDSGTGGMAAYQAAGLDESRLTVIGFGLEGTVGQAALLGHTPYRAALAMFPQFVGASLVDVAVALQQGKPVPARYETPTTMITLESFPTFYRPEGSGYALDIDAVRRLMPPR